MGEVNIDNQIKKLKDKPQVIVGSVGRILDLVLRKKIKTSTVQTFIVDEADNLLDQNQANTVKKLYFQLTHKPQTCFFSASITASTLKTAQSLVEDITVLRVNEKATLNPQIQHLYMVSEQREKFLNLKKLLQATKPKKALIFVSQNTDSISLVEKLIHHGYSVATLSGKLAKEERKAALTQFKKGQVQLLISSDLSARGLDVEDITHVFHFDMPHTSQDYLHRAGRTARAAATGFSICLPTPRDLGLIRIIERDFAINVLPVKLIKGEMKLLDREASLIELKTNSDSTGYSKPKSHNKYPKGYSKNAKAGTPASPRSKKQLAELPKEGSLEDALALIAKDSFGKNYE